MIIKTLKKRQEGKLKSFQLETAIDLYQKTVSELPQIYKFVHENFDINKIYFVNSRVLQMGTENSENMSFISEDELMDLTTQEKSLIVTFYPIPVIEEQLLRIGIRLINYTELVGLYRKHCSESSDLPLVLNTIENAFEEIYVIGRNKTADEVYAYLSTNSSINVFQIEIDDVINNTVKNASKDTVYLVVDLLPYLIEKYIRTLVIHWRKLGTDEEFMDSRRDIHDNILPKLQRGGAGHHSCYTSSIED